jgi:peroxiredoxin Q/BCP
MLSQGSPAPNISGVDQNGATHRLAASKGHTQLVYFYPKDATPGCTREACAFRDVWDQYQAAKVEVLGVSRDTSASHQRFAKKHALTFPLIADTEGTWADAFGVPRKGSGSYSRVSFLIGPDGKIAKAYPKVDPGVHAQQVLEDARTLR